MARRGRVLWRFFVPLGGACPPSGARSRRRPLEFAIYHHQGGGVITKKPFRFLGCVAAAGCGGLHFGLRAWFIVQFIIIMSSTTAGGRSRTRRREGSHTRLDTPRKNSPSKNMPHAAPTKEKARRDPLSRSPPPRSRRGTAPRCRRRRRAPTATASGRPRPNMSLGRARRERRASAARRGRRAHGDTSTRG